MSSHIQKSCVGLEATLSDSKKKYGDKVNTLLSAWEHVTNFIPAATPEVTQSLIEWVHKHTLKLVLRGEWPKLSPATKTHLSVTLQRCASLLVHHPAAPRCTALIALVHDPWTNPALNSILNDQPNSEHEEEFCCSEKGELLTMRLKILCEDRCEDIAINLAAACVRTLRRSDRLRSLSEPQHVQFMLDVYIVLLYKWKRMQDILAQLKLMDLNDALELVQRLSGEKPTKYGTARVWRNSIKAAELVAQYLVTAGMVRPVGETGANVLEQILNSWATLHAKLKDITTTLPGMIRKLIEPAESAHHIYIFCAVLLKHFSDSVKPLVIELYIRALTTDMNELENQKAKNDKDKVRETAVRLSTEFLRLADVVDSNVGIARECVLTAFSLHPTRACYDRIIEMAVACGKTKQQETQTSETSGKENVVSPSSLRQLDSKQPDRIGDGFNDKHDESASKSATKLNPSSASQSLSASLSSSRVVDQQSGVPKIFDRGDQLLKNILSSPLKDSVATERCNLHPKREPGSEGPLGELCFNCGQFTGTELKKEPIESSATNVDRSFDALILINGDAVTGSANYDERCVPNQVLDAEKLGLTPQLCDDLSVVLSSPRYHMLSWVLDWKELHMLCEKYLENPEEMGSKDKELKYLNIDYSQFKDWPSEDENEKDVFFGIEKGYEQWVDVPSDSSEQFGSFQPAGGYKRSTTRRSLDDSTDSDSGSVMRVRRTGRQRKVHRLESSESDYESAERKAKQHFRNSTSSVSDTDTNTQDSQTDSLGSDGCRLEGKNNKNSSMEAAKKRGKSKLTVDTVSHFHMLVNENIRHPTEDVSGSDVSSNDIITLFSADMDENKRETIKGSAYTSATPLIIAEKRSDPAVLKSLRMFRNSKKPVGMAQLLQKNLLNKSKESNQSSNNSSNVAKFAPMLSTLNLNPKIVLTRADEVDRKLLQKKPQQLSAGDLSSELMNIAKAMPFPANKNSIGTFHKRKGEPNDKGRTPRSPRGSKTVKSSLSKNYDILAKAVRDSDILAKNVPGLNSLDMMVPPRVQSTVNVVQLSRNIPQSPNSGSVNSGNTPPRNRTSSIAGSIQLPGTPSSGGHDSGVGMSPAGQTPPPRSSALHDVGEEANQPPDSSPTSSTNASTAEPDSPPRASSQRNSHNDSPTKSPSPSASLATTVPITSDQLHIVRTPDGSYQLAPISQNVIGAQRNVLTLQNLEDSGVVGFSRQIQREATSTGGNRDSYERQSPAKVAQQSAQNAGLPKFQQAFGKTIYTLATETTTTTTTVATTSTTGAISQQPPAVQKTTNLSKAVQTSVPNSQANAAINVSSITNIPNRQITAGRQILSIVQSASGNASVNSQSAGQTLTQIVQSAAPGGVIYTHKIPVTISTTNPSQLNIIPAISHANSIQAGRTSLVKVNIIPGGTPLRQQNIAAIQAVLSAPRIQQQPQSAQAQTQSQSSQQSAVRSETLINSPIEVPNQVSSTTLEQLREFESVLEQVKERSTTQPQLQSSTSSAATTTVQTQTGSQQSQVVVKQQQHQQTSASALAQQLLIPSQSPTSTEFTSNGSGVNFQQDVFTQKASLTYVNQSGVGSAQKVSNSTPLVVVTSYCQPAASPALSVTSQSSSSPCVTPAPAPVPSAGKTPPTPSPKSGKKSLTKTVKASATNTAAKASPIPKPQQKPQEDEQTAQRIYTILAEYAEQLRNSPDLNNKPAPRRRSNPPTNPSQSSKRKKSGSSKSKPAGPQASELSPSTDDLGRTMGSEDSSSGIVHVQDSPAGFSTQDEATTTATTTTTTTTSNVAETSTETRSLTNDSNDGVEVNVKRRNLIFTEPGSGQTRAVIVQEAVQAASVSVSEALGKMGNTAVFVPGTNYIHLPMNIQVKGGSQQFTIVSGHSKLLAAVPTVRTSGTSGVPNTLVLQSFLNTTGKIISQSPQAKQMKLPTLQTLGANQSLNSGQGVQNASVVIPQSSTSASTQFSSEPSGDKSSGETTVVKNDSGATIVTTDNSTNTILVNKSSAIGIIQRNIGDIADNQQICGVITSNPNLTLQGTRLFNSTIAKLSTPACIKTESVVCLAPATSAATVSQSTEKKVTQEHQATQSDKTVAIQGQTIALAFAAQTDVSVVNNSQSQTQLKETKEASTEITSGDKVISPKSVKRKIDDVAGVNDNITRTTLINTNSVVSPSIVSSLQSNTKIESVPALSAGNKQSSIESTAQFLVSGGPSSSDSQSSPLRQSSEALDSPCKVGNGILCGNARLQEAWDPERKASPDTPWRYVPASTNQMAIEPLKVYSRDNENSEVHSVLQIINKGQGIEMASGQVYQTNTKKYFINHTLEPFQQYPNKTSIAKSQSNPRLDRELLQQRLERKTAAMERELRLQKSLSEECEDLGVDEPSTSDLFPEADLLFDTNHSPSFDHLSQDASCSQPLGMKLYNASYYRPLDSSSGSRDTSPVAEFKVNERRKNASQRTRTLKDTLKRAKRDKSDDMQLDSPAKHIRLSLENLSQDEGSNSNSDVSRLSPGRLPMIENENESSKNTQTKMTSRNGSKEGSPSSASSEPSNMKLDMEMDSESLPPVGNANNVSAASSGDESLTLMGSNTADVTIPSPLSPIAGPLLSTHKYTYTNKKRVTSKVLRTEYLSWESPMSERTRSSSDDEDSSISESMSSQTEDNTITNGIDDSLPGGNMKNSVGDRCTYAKNKKDKLQVSARVVLNRTDSKSILSKRMKSDSMTESGVVSSDKTSEPSDDEGCHTTLIEPDCRARRSSLRGHVKKGCACCNGSPERPKKKAVKMDHKLKKKLASKQLIKKR